MTSIVIGFAIGFVIGVAVGVYLGNPVFRSHIRSAFWSLKGGTGKK